FGLRHLLRVQPKPQLVGDRREVRGGGGALRRRPRRLTVGAPAPSRTTGWLAIRVASSVTGEVLPAVAELASHRWTEADPRRAERHPEADQRGNHEGRDAEQFRGRAP